MIRFFRDPGESIGGALGGIFRGVVNSLIGVINNIPGVNVSKLEGPDSKPSPAGQGIQSSGGEMEANSFESRGDAFMSWMSPFEFTPLWEVFQEPPQPGLSDETTLQRKQDQNSDIPDNFSPDGVM